MSDAPAKLPWIFVDGTTQETFRIRYRLPTWHAPEENEDPDDSICSFDVTRDDGASFALELRIDAGVLSKHQVIDTGALATLIFKKGIDIVEGAIHSGIRRDQHLLWETDGVSVVG